VSHGVFMTPVDSDSPFWHTVAMKDSVTWFRYTVGITKCPGVSSCNNLFLEKLFYLH
jgi:ferric iron reductase protein FhuF